MGRTGVVALLCTLLAAPCARAAVPVEGARDTGDAPASGELHVPSPDWRDQVVYFLMIDRFDDGDPRNNDQGVGEFDPADGARYSGGDLRGVQRRIGYLRRLGATAVWITPPVAHQWWSDPARYGGYHGYWGEHFMRVDPHFGTLDDYRALSRALHGAGMYLVQDVVVNHVGDWFAYPQGRVAEDPAVGYEPRRDRQGRRAPSQAPFDRNDPRDPAQRAGGIYHWTPDIADYTDRVQETDWQLAGLDDLDTENAEVRRALRESYGHWIREVGVDAFRVDTAFHVPEEFFADFLHADEAAHPGVMRVARATGRDGFLAFGEGFGSDRPFADVQARKLEAYVRTPGGLPSMINFPLYGTLGDVFARGRPTAELAHRIRSMMAVHRDPHRMPTFVDNHDVDRFLAGGDEAGLKQALLAIMTLPGIPTIWQGTEQGFATRRAAMFAAGFESGGRDHFDEGAAPFRYLQRAIALRRGHRVFSRGAPTVLADSAAGAGVLVYRMDGEAAGDRALVAFNSADRPMLLDNLETGLAPGTRLRGVLAIDGEAGDVVVGPAGRVSMVLAPRAGLAWVADAGAAPPAGQEPGADASPPGGDVAGGTASPLVLDPLPAGMQRDDFEVAGSARALQALRVVVDGDLDAAQVVQADADGRWRAVVATRDMLDPGQRHRVVAWSGEVASQAREFSVERPWRLLADVADPRGDDRGRSGRYEYPKDPGWREPRPADLVRTRIYGSGGALRVVLDMAAVTAPWNPDNGFDHVAFTVFIELPDQDGGDTRMPLQHATLPEGMRWHRRLRAHGWSNALFSAHGASAGNEGAALNPAPDIDVDAQAGTVAFTFRAAALGNPASLSGAKVYVNTWDYDAGYRPLAARAGPMTFGGGDGGREPLMMDETAVVELR